MFTAEQLEAAIKGLKALASPPPEQLTEQYLDHCTDQLIDDLNLEVVHNSPAYGHIAMATVASLLENPARLPAILDMMFAIGVKVGMAI